MEHLLRLCATSTHIQHALRQPYRKTVRYRLLMTDPRCLDQRLCMQWLRSSDFDTLKDVELSFAKKRHIPRLAYRILLSLVICPPNGIFAIDMGDTGMLLFRKQQAVMPYKNFKYHITCAFWPERGDRTPGKKIAPLIAVVDSHGGLYPTTRLAKLPRLVDALICDPLTALKARHIVSKLCNLCDRCIHMFPCHNKNPGLCHCCFSKYMDTMQFNQDTAF